MLLKNFYSVESSAPRGAGFSTTLLINKDHNIFSGHFPERPVTPGVILMQLFKEELERLSNYDLQLETASNVKFSAVVDPNVDDKLILYSTFEENEGKLTLKGMADTNKVTAIKISAVYKIVK